MKKLFIVLLASMLAGCNSVEQGESLTYLGDVSNTRTYFESLQDILDLLEGDIYLPSMDEGYFMGSVYKNSYLGLNGEVVAVDFNFQNEGEPFTYTAVLSRDYDLSALELEDCQNCEMVGDYFFNGNELWFEMEDYVYGISGDPGVNRESLKRVADSVQL